MAMTISVKEQVSRLASKFLQVEELLQYGELQLDEKIRKVVKIQRDDNLWLDNKFNQLSESRSMAELTWLEKIGRIEKFKLLDKHQQFIIGQRTEECQMQEKIDEFNQTILRGENDLIKNIQVFEQNIRSKEGELYEKIMKFKNIQPTLAPTWYDKFDLLVASRKQTIYHLLEKVTEIAMKHNLINSELYEKLYQLKNARYTATKNLVDKIHLHANRQTEKPSNTAVI
jgi:hypothetical protein